VPESERDQLKAELEALRKAASNQTLASIAQGFLSALGADQLEIARAGPQVIKGLEQILGAAPASRSALKSAAARMLIEGSQNAKQLYNVAGDAEFKGNVYHYTMNIIDQMPALDESVEASFVLLAMTKAQADELASQQAFQQQPDVLQQNFASLAGYLAQIGSNDWADHYGVSPEEWRPGGERTIAKLVGDTLDELNETRELKKLVPKFYDIQSLGDGEKVSRGLVRQLRKSGCLVIVDAISLRHPLLLRAYQRSLLDVFPSTSVLTLTPGAGALKLMETMVHTLQLNLQDSEFRLRARDRVDGLSCHVDCQLETVPGWLVDQLKRIYAAAAARPRATA